MRSVGLRDNYEHRHLVSNIDQTVLGAARVAFWASVDCAVRDYYHFFRHNFLYSAYQKNSVDSGSAVCAQSCF